MFNIRLLKKSGKILSGLIITASLFSYTAEKVNAQDGEQAPVQSFTFGNPEPDFYQITKPEEAMADRGFGWTGRFGHTAGQYAGREESFSSVELMPYVYNPIDGVIFGDGRLHRANEGGMAGSIGGGYRQYFEGIDRIFGAAFYYDIDDTTRSSKFKQITLSVESLGENLDLRANFYLPKGETNKLIKSEFDEGSLRFGDHYLLYDLKRTIGYALKGIDGEMGIPIRTEFGMNHNMKLYGGAYHYQDENKVIDNIWGWKSRITADFIRNLNLNFEVAHDNYFATSVQLGVVYTFDTNNFNHKQEHKKTVDRMLDRVMRNNTVMIAQQTNIDAGFRAINPATNAPYFFRHVDSTVAGPGTGTYEDPYQQILTAQADLNYDIIFVHAGSTFNGANAEIITHAGKRILGDGLSFAGPAITHTIVDATFGTLALPHDFDNSNVKPILNNSTGHGVVLNANSEFSGFTINNPTGHGLYSFGTNHTAAGIANYNTINDATGHGIFLENLAGNLNINNTQVNYSLAGTGSNGFYVSGGNARISFSDTDNTPGINSSTVTYDYNGALPNGHSLLVENTTGGQLVMDGAVVTETDGQGILIINNLGTVSLDNGSITNSTGDGIRLENIRNLVSLNNNFLVDNAAGVGLNVFNSATEGNVVLGNLNVNNRNDIGFRYVNNSGTLRAIAGTTMSLNLGTGTADINEPGLLYQLNIDNLATAGVTEGSVTLETLNVNGSRSNGVLIGDNDADGIPEGNMSQFLVANSFSINGSNQDALVISNNLVNNRVSFLSQVQIANRNQRGILIQDDNSLTNIGVGNNVSVTNALNATVPGIDIQRNTAAISFGTTTVDNTRIPGAVLAGVFINDNESTITFDDLSILATTGDALRVIHTNPVNLQKFVVSNGAGFINALGAQAVDIINTEIDVNIGAVSSNSNNTRQFGINIRDSDGSFIINGTGAAGAFTGGTIINHTVAGINLENTNLTDLATNALTEGQVKIFQSRLQSISQTPVAILATNWTTEDAGVNVNSEVRVIQDNIASNTDFAIHTINTDQVLLDRNFMNNNGTAAGEETVFLEVTRNRTGDNKAYFYDIIGNTITDQNADAVVITGISNDPLDSDPTDDPHTPVLLLNVADSGAVRNTFNVTSTATTAFRVDWNGNIQRAIFDHNIFNVTGAGFTNNVGLNITGNYNEDNIGSNGIELTNNNFNINSVNGRGFVYDIDEGNILDINNNNIQVVGNNGLGIDIITGSTNNVNLDTNTIRVGNTNGTGVNINITGVDNNDATNILSADNRYFINGNTIILPDAGGVNFEQGIIFSSIIGPNVKLNPGINSADLVDNIIVNAIPAPVVNTVDVFIGNALQLQSKVQGTIKINGTNFSFP